jgi:hypothetical protein
MPPSVNEFMGRNMGRNADCGLEPGRDVEGATSRSAARALDDDFQPQVGARHPEGVEFVDAAVKSRGQIV